jgi:branched-chain amino acid aminotransferase
MFFVIDGEVITSPLTGSILPGVTRDSVIKIVKAWGMKMTEKSLAIEDLIHAAQNGKLQEAFGTGTAAVISPVGQITYRGKDFIVAGGKMGDLSQRLYNEIVAIQYGEKADPFGWREKIG